MIQRHFELHRHVEVQRDFEIHESLEVQLDCAGSLAARSAQVGLIERSILRDLSLPESAQTDSPNLRSGRAGPCLVDHSFWACCAGDSARDRVRDS